MVSPLKFLVVDALAGVRTFARQLLLAHGLAADQVLGCADTEAALAQGLAFQPHVLVTDWFAKAPLTGVQLYQRLRDVQPTLQLGLLSFDATPEHEFEAQVLGAHFLLKKPFTAGELQAEIARLLERQAPGAPARARPPARPVAALIPPQPVLKPGDAVRYDGALHTALHVVHRQGRTVVQLKGQSGFVPLEKLQPA